MARIASGRFACLDAGTATGGNRGKIRPSGKARREVGDQQQQLRVAYNRAWTAYWWFEDTDEFNRLYSQVEAWATTSDEADDLELLGNIWTVLHTSCAAGTIDESVSDRKRRTATLVGALEKCAADISRPNNSLWARTQLLLKKLTSAINKPDGIGPLLADLRKIIQTADGLVTYPFEPIARIVEELGEWLSTHDEYDALLEKVADITQKRVGAHQAEYFWRVAFTRFARVAATTRFDCSDALNRSWRCTNLWMSSLRRCSAAVSPMSQSGCYGRHVQTLLWQPISR